MSSLYNTKNNESDKNILIEISDFLKRGYYSQAETKIDKLIKEFPKELKYQNLLAIILVAQKKYKKAILILKKIISKSPNYIESYINLGNIYNDLSQLENAEFYLKKAISNNPKNKLALYNLAQVYDKRQNYKNALIIFSDLLITEPNNLEYLNSYSGIQIKLENFDKAEKTLKKILKIKPNYIDAFINLGLVYKNKNQINKAILTYSSALRIIPRHPILNYNLGNFYEKKNEFPTAIKYYNSAIKYNSKYVAAYYNMACVFDYLGKYDQAIKNYKKAIYYNSQHQGAIYNLARDLLRTDDFENGWRGYELRSGGVDINYKKLNIPLEKIWNGKKFNGPLVVHAEQGIGDEILYSSIFSDLQNKHKNLVITVDDRLITIMQRSFPKIKFISRNKNFVTNKFAKHILAGSLGKFFRSSVNDFKDNKDGWLTPNKSNIKYIDKLIPNSKKIRVGISWKSSANAFDKNIPLIDLLSILKERHFEVVNLQYGTNHKEIKKQEIVKIKKIIHLNNFDYTNDLEKIFALINSCDFILSISNSLIHFAGALGKPVFSLIPSRSHWYWHTKRKKCLWYPSVKIYKQTKWRKWNDLIKEVRKEIKLRYG